MTRKIYYSKSEGAFLFSDVHGEKTVMIPDPSWDYPLKKIPDLEWVGDDEKDRPQIEVPDTSVEWPLVEILNPRFQPDAVEVSEKEYEALMKAQKAGKRIECDENGYPHAVEPSQEILAQRARMERDRLIASVSWRYERYARETRLGIEPSEDISKLDDYVQKLADLPSQKGFPQKVSWPTLKE